MYSTQVLKKKFLTKAEFCDFCGIHKKSTIVIVNYGVSEAFMEKLKKEFGYSGVFCFVSPENINDELKKISG